MTGPDNRPLPAAPGQAPRDTAVFLVLRRLRQPLIVLISAYTIAIVGFTLMPGTDDQGQPWSMSLFEAFYVVTYTAPTIGFGELPYPFSGAQRLWTAFTIYLTVLAWLYSVGSLISLMQDQALRETLQRWRFQRAVLRIDQPFWLVCGLGDSGQRLLHALTEQGRQAVVIDPDPRRVETLDLTSGSTGVLAMFADPRNPQVLREAGLGDRHCFAALAVTDDDLTNLKIAISSKLLKPSLPVLCQGSDPVVTANMASFNTDLILNPFEAFALQLELALRAPKALRVYHSLTQVPHSRIQHWPDPPRGPWLICGYGRLGRAIHERLQRLGIATVLVDPVAAAPDPDQPLVRGIGTEAHTLLEAGVMNARGLIAATADDVDNLSIVMTARDLNPELFTIARENAVANALLFDAAALDLVVRPGELVTGQALTVLPTPLLRPVLDAVLERDENWNAALADRLGALDNGRAPDVWKLRISARRSPVLNQVLAVEGRSVTLGQLCLDPRDRRRSVAAIALVLERDRERIILPDPDTPLQPADQLAFCGTAEALRLMRRLTGQPVDLHYVLTGGDPPQRWIGKRLAR